jgi:myo-inositol-1-phosphate synthase
VNRRVRVAMAGIGSNCSSFVQMVELSRRCDEALPGVMYDEIGGYRLRDIEFTTGFEVDRNKIGLDLAHAIFTSPTVAKEHVQVDPQMVIVEPGPQLDGLGPGLAKVIEPHPDCRSITVEHVARRLRDTSSEVFVCFLPAGASDAVRAYAEASARAGTAFVNATPELVANDSELARLFEEWRVPLLGDDLRSHFGATTLHTALIDLLHSRAIEVVNSYQLNVGGNTDFLNLSDPDRARSKHQSKRNALFASGIDASAVFAGPNGYVSYLGDTKVCFLRIEATSILNSPIVLDVRLEVEDSPNAAGVIANAVRVAKAAGDRGLTGVVDAVCPFLFKSPRRGATESEGLLMFRRFVESLPSPNGLSG